MAKTWWYYGKTYQQIGITKEEKYKNLDATPADKALKAYVKALRLNFKDTENQKLDIYNNENDQITFFRLLGDQSTRYISQELLGDIIMNRLPNLATAFVNMGVTQYKEEKNYEKALESFKNSLFLSGLSFKVDTPIYYYAALASEKIDKWDEAVGFYKVLTRVKYGKNAKEKSDMYLYLAKAYNKIGKDKKYLKSIKKGIELYPDGGAGLIVELINYYLGKGETDAALDYLNVAIEKTPDNASIYFAKGSLLDTINPAEAEKAYLKSIELDPDYLNPNYNLGALYYNQAADILTKAQDVDDMKVYDKMKEESNVKLKSALPFMEKAYQLDPKDAATKSTLKTIYYKLQMMEKFEEIKKVIEGK